jgi:hypothetical protein
MTSNLLRHEFLRSYTKTYEQSLIEEFFHIRDDSHRVPDRSPSKKDLIWKNYHYIRMIGQSALGNFQPIIEMVLSGMNGLKKQFDGITNNLITKTCFELEKKLTCEKNFNEEKIIEQLCLFDEEQKWHVAAESEDPSTINKYKVFFWFHAAHLIELSTKTRLDKNAILGLQKIAAGARTMGLLTLKKRTKIPAEIAKVHARALGGISTAEHDWVSRRLERVLETQKVLFNDNSLRKPLRMGICLSGGGYRAMTYAAGFLTALQKMGLVDASLYVSGLSGSTWFMMPWLLSGQNPEKYKNELEKIIPKANILHIADSPEKLDVKRFVDDVILPKALSGKPITSVDFYGGLLARALLNHHESRRHELTMEDIAESIETAEFPFPIFTTISATQTGTKNEKWYSWYEVNPYEFENDTLGLSIPISALGSKFNNGKTEILPLEKLGSLMGTFGSAYTINLSHPIDSGIIGGSFIRTAATVGANLVFPAGLFDGERLSPTKHNNPWFRLPETIISERFVSENQAEGITQPEHFTFNDAGIDFNLPLIPLLKRLRDLDVILVGDASAGDIDKEYRMPDGVRGCPAELSKFFFAVQRYGIEYERKEFQDETKNSALNFSVYVPKNASNPREPVWIEGEKLPILIYFNFLTDKKTIEDSKNNPELYKLVEEHGLENFDAMNCLEGYGNTFNFEYHSDEFAQLAAVGEFNVLAHRADIMAVIKEALYPNDNEEKIKIIKAMLEQSLAKEKKD